MSASISELDLKEQIARIDRAQEETRKFQEETRKFVAEQHKLMAEAAKLDRDRKLAPIVITASVLAGVTAGLISLAVKVLGG